jgi:ribosome-associated protein
VSNLKIENRLAVKKKAAVKKAVKSTSRRKAAPANNLRDVIIESIKDKKGENIVSLDLSKINDAIADCFIICQADSSVQVRAIAEHIIEQADKLVNEAPWHKEGFSKMDWVLLDYVDCVVHIFQPQAREFYQLEELWLDAKRKEH